MDNTLRLVTRIGKISYIKRIISRATMALAIADQFLTKARQVRSDQELADLLADVCSELGFRYYALIDHVDLRRSMPHIVHIDNYPSVWSEHFIRNQLYIDDPVIHASLRTNLAFVWEELPSLIKLSSPQTQILREAARNGLKNGVTIPANIPGQVHGSCSFAVHASKRLPLRSLNAAFIIGAFAFAAARRIRRDALGPVRETPKLTRRQRQCLILVASGKTDWEIGKILGLSEETVTKYLNAARARYDVVTRAQLVTAALFDGQIGFMEIRDIQ